MSDGITVAPANEASWEDLQAVLGERGYAAACQCQRFKIGQSGYSPGTRAERAAHLREETNCGRPGARATSGLIAYLDGEPVGWCAASHTRWRGPRSTSRANAGQEPWRRTR